MILYWIAIIADTIFGMQLSFLKLLILAISSIIFIIKRDDKLAQQLLLAFITLPLYSVTLNIWIYLPLSIIMFAWSVWISKRTDIGYLPYNHTNICIAFYKGPNRSFKSSFMSLIGLNFTSVGILCNGFIYRYRHGRIIKTSHNIDEYVMYDTNVKPDEAISNLLENMTKVNYTKSLHRSNCVDILSPLLIELDVEPKNYIQTIPSIYIRRLLKNVR